MPHNTEQASVTAHYIFMFGSWWVRISAEMESTMKEFSRGFPETPQANKGIVLVWSQILSVRCFTVP
jgi:hypothetical protein